MGAESRKSWAEGNLASLCAGVKGDSPDQGWQRWREAGGTANLPQVSTVRAPSLPLGSRWGKEGSAWLVQRTVLSSENTEFIGQSYKGGKGCWSQEAWVLVLTPRGCLV